MSPLGRWLDYKAVGKRLHGTRFIAFKVPLKQVSGSMKCAGETSVSWWCLRASGDHEAAVCFLSGSEPSAATLGRLRALGAAGRSEQGEPRAGFDHRPDLHHTLLQTRGKHTHTHTHMFYCAFSSVWLIQAPSLSLCSGRTRLSAVCEDLHCWSWGSQWRHDPELQTRRTKVSTRQRR